MYIIICETDQQSRFNAWDRVLGAGALGWPRGMGWGGRWERLYSDVKQTSGNFSSVQFSCSVVSDNLQPHGRQPTRLCHPWDSPGKNTGVGCYFLLQRMKVKSESEVAQLCLTLCDPMDCSLPGSSIHGICQARVLEWGAIAFSTIQYINAYIWNLERW